MITFHLKSILMYNDSHCQLVATYLLTEGQNEALKYSIHTKQCNYVHKCEASLESGAKGMKHILPAGC